MWMHMHLRTCVAIALHVYKIYVTLRNYKPGEWDLYALVIGQTAGNIFIKPGIFLWNPGRIAPNPVRPMSHFALIPIRPRSFRPDSVSPRFPFALIY
jgi:hypothetical protein